MTSPVYVTIQKYEVKKIKNKETKRKHMHKSYAQDQRSAFIPFLFHPDLKI